MFKNTLKPIFLLLSLYLPQTSYADSQADYQIGLEAYQREDLITAIESLRSAADSGHAKAQCLLGYVFDIAEENEQALHYYQLAADQGEAEGAYGLGSLYATGQGVAQDHEQAVRLYQQAAEAGHLMAIDVLVTAYLDGGLSLTKDRQKAILLLERSAELGHSSSLQRLKSIKDESGI
ncbi:MAG: sel1 repeat family protein [Candidatus Thiodiazotropha lotti]|nr:sel1 repeat family protein [Candidatus Thiodiazotropha lotti]MCW4221373.1 sel1 repeat family protein [Candidatus Thiodiazotropha lotti]